MQFALFKTRSIVFQPPHGHIPCLPCADRDDDVGKRGPCVIQVELGRPRRMIRMGMIKPQQLAAQLRRPALRHSIVRRAHEKPAPRPFFGCVRQRHARRHVAAGPGVSNISDKGSAAFVRIRFLAMAPDRIVHGRADPDSTISHFHRPSRSCRSGISPRRQGKS
jgi:hypothetical protein